MTMTTTTTTPTTAAARRSSVVVRNFRNFRTFGTGTGTGTGTRSGRIRTVRRRRRRRRFRRRSTSTWQCHHKSVVAALQALLQLLQRFLHLPPFLLLLAGILVLLQLQEQQQQPLPYFGAVVAAAATAAGAPAEAPVAADCEGTTVCETDADGVPAAAAVGVGTPPGGVGKQTTARRSSHPSSEQQHQHHHQQQYHHQQGNSSADDDRSCSNYSSFSSSSPTRTSSSSSSFVGSEAASTVSETATRRVSVSPITITITGSNSNSNSDTHSDSDSDSNSDTHSTENLRRQFLDDGYVVVRRFFTSTEPSASASASATAATETTETSSETETTLPLLLLLSSWRTYSEQYFDWLFATLYRKKRTPFDVHGRKLKKRGKTTTTTTSSSSSSSSSSNRSNNEDTQPRQSNTAAAAAAGSKYEYALPVGTSSGYKEIVHRHPGRYEIRILLTGTSTKTAAADPEQDDSGPEPDTDTDTEPPLVPPLQPIIDQVTPLAAAILLGGQSSSGKKGNGIDDTETDGTAYNYLNLQHSLIVAMPGSTAQRWHTDSGHLSSTEQLPPHCLNVFLPLVDVTRYKGMTEIVPKSHRLSRRQERPQSQGQRGGQGPELDTGAGYRVEITDDNKPVANVLDVGDMLVFDYRVWHRGLENKTNKPRPVLVLTFSVPQWKDTLNWPSRSMFDDIDDDIDIDDDDGHAK